ncbi:hypothetical protein GRX03_11095 [Halovenus sp. WSH3]|uniref:Uncharacterized protein n=1 Tax=Halovenus carboxidivorans TaxID=2692199 RepID=A0A6B0T999_9EURY|nr:hypothetical protein [Halovenus carboxidivorans]MXR52143.1 hypothetical protein [Halovenus carboxidivorans]
MSESEDDSGPLVALSGGLGATVGSALAGLTSVSLGALALAAGVGAAVGYGSYRVLDGVRAE